MHTYTYGCRRHANRSCAPVYERAPFPIIRHAGSLSWLRARAERSQFARLIDEQFPATSRRRDWVWHRPDDLYWRVLIEL